MLSRIPIYWGKKTYNYNINNHTFSAFHTEMFIKLVFRLNSLIMLINRKTQTAKTGIDCIMQGVR